MNFQRFLVTDFVSEIVVVVAVATLVNCFVKDVYDAVKSFLNTKRQTKTA